MRFSSLRRSQTCTCVLEGVVARGASPATAVPGARARVAPTLAPPPRASSRWTAAVLMGRPRESQLQAVPRAEEVVEGGREPTSAPLNRRRSSARGSVPEALEACPTVPFERRQLWQQSG